MVYSVYAHKSKKHTPTKKKHHTFFGAGLGDARGFGRFRV
jgi:hypothetical protein